ncbi:MAG: PEGA domain-containing protein [Lachnospiraceae bacterium]|nr:PEGA domain-containing protein [Lachnospiraceae bacterium]
MKKAIVPICVILFIVFIGCYFIIMEYARERAADRAANKIVSENYVEESLSRSDEGIQGILLSIDDENKILGFQDIKSARLYEIPYDDNLRIQSKYGNVMSMAELQKGEVYKLYYTRSIKKLTGLQVSDSTWVYTDVTKFSFDENKKIMMIGDEAYKFTNDLRIYSDNIEVQIMDITEMDRLIVRGYDKQVLSVVVDKGHGYLRILNDVYFIGGWIEIGQDIIKPVTEDMLIPVGEGDYLVRVTNRGYAGEQEVSVSRDRETKLDLSKIDIEEVSIGHVKFIISPDYARLYIDDEITEFEDRVPMEYGIHSIRVECAGYETINSYIKVGSDYAEISIEMDESEENISEKESVSDNKTKPSVIPDSNNAVSDNSLTVSKNSISQNSASVYNSETVNKPVISGEKKIYIEQPEQTEIYLDGNYIGIAPVSTAKVTGSHVITLSKDGYQTKSYTVNIANDEKDITFSFSSLIKN